MLRDIKDVTAKEKKAILRQFKTLIKFKFDIRKLTKILYNYFVDVCNFDYQFERGCFWTANFENKLSRTCFFDNLKEELKEHMEYKEWQFTRDENGVETERHEYSNSYGDLAEEMLKVIEGMNRHEKVYKRHTKIYK